MLTVKRLKELLSDYPDQHIIILASDSEGNSFSPMSEADQGGYFAETNSWGEYRHSDDDPPIVNAVCLWPRQ
jgi:hypothetical protein